MLFELPRAIQNDLASHIGAPSLEFDTCDPRSVLMCSRTVHPIQPTTKWVWHPPTVCESWNRAFNIVYLAPPTGQGEEVYTVDVDEHRISSAAGRVSRTCPLKTSKSHASLFKGVTSAVRPEPLLLRGWFWWWRCWGHRPHGGCLSPLQCWSPGLSYPAGGWGGRAEGELARTGHRVRLEGSSVRLTLSSVISSYSISPSVPFTWNRNSGFIFTEKKPLNFKDTPEPCL